MELKDFWFDLPDSAIAQEPRSPRDSALLLVAPKSGSFVHTTFLRLKELMREGDLLVVNDSKTVKARLFGNRETGGKCELLLLSRAGADGSWDALVRPAKKMKEGEKVRIGGHSVEIVKEFGEGRREVKFLDCDAVKLLERYGHTPLPPYIQRDDNDTDKHNYQTVYADEGFSVAAPTAGLHFTERVLRSLEEKGVGMTRIRLDVGLGTFRPITAEKIEDHRMHSEKYFISAGAADKINLAMKEKRRIIGVGTTVVRTLEDQMRRFGEIKAGAFETDIFITPGFEFKAVDAMITNFHLPGSTLLLLVSAFAGREKILEAYKEAIAKGYSFYSYGDAMWLERAD